MSKKKTKEEEFNDSFSEKVNEFESSFGECFKTTKEVRVGMEVRSVNSKRVGKILQIVDEKTVVTQFGDAKNKVKMPVENLTKFNKL